MFQALLSELLSLVIEERVQSGADEPPEHSRCRPYKCIRRHLVSENLVVGKLFDFVQHNNPFLVVSLYERILLRRKKKSPCFGLFFLISS